MNRRLQRRLAFAAMFVCVVSRVEAQTNWMRAYGARSERFMGTEPTWASPVFSTSPALRQVFRQDFIRTSLSPGDTDWNLGGGKGLEFVPLPRTQFVVAAGAFALHNTASPSGFGDVSISIKNKLYASAGGVGCDCILSSYVTVTIPTSSSGNGTNAVTWTPALLGGKGFGRIALLGTLAGRLPQAQTVALGRTLATSTIRQFHATRFLWLAAESNTTAFLGGPHDGNTQSFLGPSFVVGRMPYHRRSAESQRGFSVGAGYQFAVTPFHTYNQALSITTRFHF